MRARSFSHTGVTVSDFNKFVSFYADIFGCRLVGVADTPPERVRAFFGVDAELPKCKIGWLRMPGGGILEIFHFTPHELPEPVVWNRVGITHISIDVRNTKKWHDYLVKKGVDIVSEPEQSRFGHTFFFAKDCDGNLIELMDLKGRYLPLKWLGSFAGWLFRLKMYKDYYRPAT